MIDKEKDSSIEHAKSMLGSKMQEQGYIIRVSMNQLISSWLNLNFPIIPPSYYNIFLNDLVLPGHSPEFLFIYSVAIIIIIIRKIN